MIAAMAAATVTGSNTAWLRYQPTVELGERKLKGSPTRLGICVKSPAQTLLLIYLLCSPRCNL